MTLKYALVLFFIQILPQHAEKKRHQFERTFLNIFFKTGQNILCYLHSN